MTAHALTALRQLLPRQPRTNRSLRLAHQWSCRQPVIRVVWHQAGRLQRPGRLPDLQL